MSRSFKKTPIVKDGHSGKPGKRLANRKVRRFKGRIPNGRWYRKLYESWDIHDYVSWYPLSELRQRLESEEKAFLNGAIPYWEYRSRYRLDENRWAKYYRRK